jgi:hypothetical protein
MRVMAWMLSVLGLVVGMLALALVGFMLYWVVSGGIAHVR